MARTTATTSALTGRGWPQPAWSWAGILVAVMFVQGGVRAADPSPASSHVAATSTPAATTSPAAWPTGDALRRDLQLIGFVFRVDRAAGEWTGWAPTFALDRPASLRLGVDGRQPAWAAFELDLMAVEARAVDVDATLTALLEVVTRLPLPSSHAAKLFEFITADLLTSAPEQLEACAATRLAEGVAVIRVDMETGLASLLLAQTADAREPGADIAECVPIRPASLGPAPGALSSERLTVTATDAAEATGGTSFEPAESTVEGSVVTIVLTFRNETSVEHTLTFGEPVDSDSGPIGPGQERLIVLRRLEPGVYPFFSATDPTGMMGLLRVVEPPEPEEP